MLPCCYENMIGVCRQAVCAVAAVSSPIFKSACSVHQVTAVTVLLGGCPPAQSKYRFLHP